MPDHRIECLAHETTVIKIAELKKDIDHIIEAVDAVKERIDTLSTHEQLNSLKEVYGDLRKCVVHNYATIVQLSNVKKEFDTIIKPIRLLVWGAVGIICSTFLTGLVYMVFSLKKG